MKNVDIPRDCLRDLLAKTARRDTRAFEEIVRFYNGRLTRFASFKLHDPHEVNEVVNDTFLSIWKDPLGFQHQSAFFTFLVSIVNKKIIDIYRRHGRQIQTSELSDSVESPAALEDTLVDEGLDPAIWVDQVKALQRFHACKDKLSPEQQEILFWLFEMEATEKDAAQACNCPLGTVKSRFAAARLSLKRCLMGWFREVHHARS